MKDRPPEAETPALSEPTLVNYLRSPQGHEVATRVVGVIEALQKATLESGAEQAKLGMEYGHRDRVWGLIVHTIVLVLVVGTAGFLSYNARLDATTGLLLGTLAGYFFGRRAGG